MLLMLVVLAPTLAALLPLATPLGAPRRWTRIGLAALAALAPLALVGRADALSLGFATLVDAIAFLATAFSAGGATWNRRVGDLVGDPRETAPWTRVSVYYALLGAFWSAMLMMVLATTFTVLWLGLSATTLATAFLVGFAGGSSALEAAWKYLVLCSVGIAFALLGLLVLAHVAFAAGVPPAQALDWNTLVARAPRDAPPLARLAVALMTLGFATKAGLVPMHAWLPDAHAKAPAPISALLSGVLVSCAFYALLRTLTVADAFGAAPLAHGLLLALGALSTLVAGALMLAQTDLKRLLAYSTIEHAGVVALALGFGGRLGMLAALVHLVAHAFAKSAAFFSTGLIQRERGTTTIAGLHALWCTRGPGRMLLGALSALAGLPPFGLFVGELLVVVAGVLSRQWLPLAAGVVGIAFGFAALARAAIAMESGHEGTAATRVTGFRRTPAAAGAAALALVGACAIAVMPWVAR